MAKLRKTTIKDIPQLIEIYMEFMIEISKLDPFYTQDMEYWKDESRQDYMKLTKRRDRRFIFLEEDGKLMGFMDIFIKKRDDAYKIWKTGHIESIYIRPQYRGKGYSKMMIDYAMGWFEKRGKTHFTVGTYALDSSARRYWEKLGYKEYFVLYHK